jgi:amino acid transporter
MSFMKLTTSVASLVSLPFRPVTSPNASDTPLEISMTASLVLPSSRQAFAFARDGALPFSKFFYKVDSWTGTPVRTVWLVVGCAMPLGLLCFADPVNYSAINAIFTLAILGPYVAYGIPILSCGGTPTSSAVHGTSAVSPSRAPSSRVCG